jgi:putative YphP/YqiW family bacilliredoxin
MFQVASKYPLEIVQPMKDELTSVGIKELVTTDEVDKALKSTDGTTFVVINSVCGCAAGNARPAVRMALDHNTLPNNMTTVFAGVDQEAVARVREHIPGYPASSPSMALFKNGNLVFMLPRHRIEGRFPQEIAGDLIQAFDEHCK